jgi:hypothetical protein
LEKRSRLKDVLRSLANEERIPGQGAVCRRDIKTAVVVRSRLADETADRAETAATL